MSAAVSPSSGQVYGISRLCRSLGLPRSSFYARRLRERTAGPREAPGKRGRKTPFSDEQLLELIHTDTAGAPAPGEGHRRIWLRLRLARGVHVSRKRVLRILREHGLLTPRPEPRQPTPPPISAPTRRAPASERAQPC